MNNRYFPQIYEFVETTTDNGKPCLLVIEEHISGENYQEILDKNGILPEQEVLKLGIWLCQALSTLHHLNPLIIHRDVKPSNIIRQRGGQLCLIDFNMANCAPGNFQSSLGKMSEPVIRTGIRFS